jgi:tetratricopeptide (TPR) repeat protein
MTIALMRSRMATLVYTSHPSTELKEVLGISLEFKKDILLFCEMSQAIYKKFPDRRQEIWRLIYECMQGIRLVLQMIKSATDDRYKRSLTEWVTITKYAMETSPEAASKRFYGITPDGKRIHLSPKHIKDKIEEVNNFMDKFLEFITKVPLNIRILSNIVRNDPELMQQYQKLSKQYNAENKQKILEEMEEVYEDDRNIRNQSQHHEYQYGYYKIVHYDKDLYEKQKSEYQKGLRKSKPDGRIECRVKAEELGFTDII